MRRCGLPILAALCIAWLQVPAEVRAQSGILWRPDERVLITAFHLAISLAKDERLLYAASDRGLQRMDLLSGRWEYPSTVEDGYPVEEEPRAIAFDELNRILWLGTLSGNLYSYQVDLAHWEAEGSPNVGPILRLVSVAQGRGRGLYLRSPSGWFKLDPFGLIAEPVAAGRLALELALLELAPEERLARLDPAYASAQGTLTIENGRRWPLTDFLPGDRAGEFWLATAGNNLYRYDSRFVSADAHRFGLLTRGTTALARDGGEIWFGGDGFGPRRGVTRADRALQDWQYYESGVSRAPGRRIDDILVAEEGTWFASAEGLLLFSGGRWTRARGAAGQEPIRRLAPRAGGGVWAAGSRGLFGIDEAGGVGEAFLVGQRVYAVLTRGEAVWVGSDDGLLRFREDGRVIPWPNGASPPRAPVVDLAVAKDTVWAATADALWAFDGESWTGPLREAALAGVNRIFRLRVFDDELWIAGLGGVAHRGGRQGNTATLLVGPDIPAGPVTDVLRDGRRVWVATPEGALRLEWRGRLP